MTAAAEMERFQSGIFRRLVFLYMMQAIVFSITGMVDCAVVGRGWGAGGLAGMKLAMPVFAVLYLLFGSVLSSGFSVQVSNLLSKGNRDSANQCLLWVVAAAAGLSLLFVLAAGLIPGPLTTLFAGRIEDAAIYGYTRGYLLPILFGSLPILLHSILSAVAALEGADKRMAVSVAVVLASDIIGDFLAVKLNAGIQGVAIASVAAYLFACLVLAGQFFSGKTIFRPDRLRREKGILTAVVISGFPMAVKGLCEFICPVAVNRLMLRYGTVAGLAALSIQDAVHYLPLAFCEGLAAAVLLLTGMYASEQDEDALRAERRQICRYSVGFGSLWALVLMAAAPLMVMLFTRDSMIRALGILAFRWYLLGLPFVSLNYGIRAYLQGMGRHRASSFFTLFNQLLFPAAFAFFLGRFWGGSGIFAAFAIHEIALFLCYAIRQFLWKETGELSGDTEKGEHISAELRGSLASVEQVTEASEGVVRLCETHGINRKQAMQVGLCLEELGTNSLQHGFKKGTPGYLEFRFIITGDWLILRLRDNGRPFDLTEKYRLIHPEDSVSRLGLRLVFASAENISYSHTFDMNNVCIRVPARRER